MNVGVAAGSSIPGIGIRMESSNSEKKLLSGAKGGYRKAVTNANLRPKSRHRMHDDKRIYQIHDKSVHPQGIRSSESSTARLYEKQVINRISLNKPKCSIAHILR
jgi:hypothetical protein